MGVCDPQLTAFTALECLKKVGGIQAIIIIDCAVGVIDSTDPVVINALLAAGTARKIEVVRGSEPDPEAKELPNNDGGGKLTIKSRHNRFIEFRDDAYTDANITAYNILNGAEKQVILRYKNNGEQRYISIPVLFSVADHNPDNDDDTQHFIITGEYNSKNIFGITPELVGVYTQ